MSRLILLSVPIGNPDDLTLRGRKILEEKIFDNIWIQPAAGDAGGPGGCAQAERQPTKGGELARPQQASRA